MLANPRHLLHAALAGLCFMTMAAGHAQDTRGGDPARWYVEDATPQEQMRTLRKEIGAALQEAQADCRRGPARERSACMKEARSIYEQDMANAQQQRAAAHPRR